MKYNYRIRKWEKVILRTEFPEVQQEAQDRVIREEVPLLKSLIGVIGKMPDVIHSGFHITDKNKKDWEVLDAVADCLGFNRAQMLRCINLLHVLRGMHCGICGKGCELSKAILHRGQIVHRKCVPSLKKKKGRHKSGDKMRHNRGDKRKPILTFRCFECEEEFDLSYSPGNITEVSCPHCGIQGHYSEFTLKRKVYPN